MARYVDGFVVPVPKKKVEAYRRLARPRLANTMGPKALPFDGKRMIHGGFTSMVWL